MTSARRLSPAWAFLPVVLLLTLASCLHTQALTINLIYDSSVTSLPNAAQYEAATNYAAQQLESFLTDNITVNIEVVAVSGTSVFGESEYGLYGPYTYAQIRSDLASNAKTANDAIAIANLPTSDPTGGGEFFVNFAQAKSLGITGPSSASDGMFMFGTGYSFTLDPTHRAVSGEYDFIGVAEHEMTEVMGRVPLLGANLDSSNPHTPCYLPYDLFRFSAPGTRSLIASQNNYFSINNGATNLKTYNYPNGNGSDPQDWASGTNDACNAFSDPSVENDFTTVDITAMDVIGYTAATNPTDTPTMPLWATALLAIVLFLFSARLLSQPRQTANVF